MVLKPPNIIRLPSNGVSLISHDCIRASSIPALLPQSRASFEGQTIHENMTSCSSVHLIAKGNEFQYVAKHKNVLHDQVKLAHIQQQS